MAICEDIGYKNPPNKSGITMEMLVDGCLTDSIVGYIKAKTGCANDAVTRATRNCFVDRDRTSNSSLLKFILSKWELRHCSGCTTVKEEIEFYNSSDRFDGISNYCKTCSKAARVATYHKDPSKEISNNNLRKRNMHTPSWADLKAISNWHLNRPEGMHVDHIIPINSDLVCGLNIETNLQYLTIAANLAKSNKYTIE